MKTQEIINEINQLTKIQLKEVDFLGSGIKASVYRYTLKNHQVVVKCFQKQQDAEKEQSLLEDIRRLTNQCPGIIEYYGMKKLQIEITGNFDTISKGYVMFLQECPKDFKNYLNQGKHLLPTEVFEFLSQLAVALLSLHEIGCCHRDLKPSNIMLNKKNRKLVYYLADFGESKQFGTQIAGYEDFSTLRGTPKYLSPELFKIYKSSEIYGRYNPQKADIYSLGIITLELLLGEEQVFKLNATRNSEEEFNLELENIKSKLLQIDEFSKEQILVDIILKMISYKSQDGITAIEICQHLITAKQFNIECIEETNLLALISKLIE